MECKRCGHEWVTRTDIPKQCPKCKQYHYNKDREWERNTNIDTGVSEPDIKQPTESNNKQEESIKLD